ncbi:hypothetical protein ACXYTP_02050 [Tsukamurella ocularis]|uniref:hypothetical protein n=1 Tax=Tsukamurella ocularis TaxID=1970234 RepID=UPI0039EF83B2
MTIESRVVAQSTADPMSVHFSAPAGQSQFPVDSRRRHRAALICADAGARGPAPEELSGPGA